MKKILIGSCGGLTGFYLAKSFKQFDDVVVNGFDASMQNPTRFIVDNFYKMPVASDDNFINELLSLLNRENIDIYLPTHSKEIVAISKNEEIIRKNWNGFFIVSPIESYHALDNKVSMVENFAKIGVPVPKIYNEPTDENAYPLFMKPNTGSGSNNNFNVTSSEFHKILLKEFPNSTCFEKIVGKEVTVDCMFDNNGKLLGYNQRQRIKNMGGATIVTKNVDFIDILPFLEKIASAFTIKGCVNFQYILVDNVPYFIDVNLRYASGGLPLSVNSGLNVPQMILDLADNKSPSTFIGTFKENIMYRYFNEIFEEN